MTAIPGVPQNVELWRNTSRGASAKALSASASYPGRGHRPGDRAPLYGGESLAVADDEFLHAHPAYAGVEIRSTRLIGDLLVLDGTKGIDVNGDRIAPSELADPADRSTCQQVAQELFAQGYQALRLLSSRARRAGTIVIVEYQAALDLLEEVEVLYRVAMAAERGA
jgi:RES domain